MTRSCEACGGSLAGKRSSARFCDSACRMRARRSSSTGQQPALSDKVQGPLGRELQQLGVADSYEGAIALGLAAQLDSGAVTGTAYVSLSKELDRRVEDLRRKAPRPDDRTVQAREAVQARRLRLASG